jgi:hypothetical protein
VAKQGAPSTTRKVLLRKARVFGATAAAAAAVAGGTTSATATSATATAAPRGAAPGAGSMDHVVGQIQDNVQAALDKLSQQLSFGMVPIGTVIFVHKDLPGVPAVTENFQLCDGGKVTDNRSPLFGQLLPNIVAGGAGGVGLFVRGATTSGVVQAADQVVPAHAHDLNSHVHSLNAHTHGVGTFAVGTHTHLGGTLNWAHQHQISTSGTTGTVYTAVTAVNRTLVGSTTPGQNLTDIPDVTHGSNSWTGASGGTQPTFTGTSAGPSTANTLGPSPTSTAIDGGSGAETRPANVGLTPYMRIW